MLLTFITRFGHESHDLSSKFVQRALLKPSKTHSPKHNHANTPEKECQVHGCTPEILALRRLGLKGPEFEDLAYGTRS